MVPLTAITKQQKQKTTVSPATPSRRRPHSAVVDPQPCAAPAAPAAESSGTPAPAAQFNDAAPPAIVVRNPMEEKTVTVKEAAYRLRKSPDAVYGWLRSGRLRGWQPGGPRCPILVEECSVDEALRFTFSRAGAGRSSPAAGALIR